MNDAELATDHLDAIRNLRKCIENMSAEEVRQFSNAMALETQHWRRLGDEMAVRQIRDDRTMEA